MILGVAQLVVNVAELDEPVRALEAAGYQRSFEQRAIPNHPAKLELQAHPREWLDMVHLAAPAAGVAVELTAYAGEPPAGRAAFGFDVPAPGERARVRVDAADRDASLRFWRDSLGFREGEAGGLTFAAIRPEWVLEVELAEAGSDEATSVDAYGCVLVTLLTTGLQADLGKLHQDGLLLRSTPPWEESIDGRLLSVAMVEGPSGELIELIELPRQS